MIDKNKNVFLVLALVAVLAIVSALFVFQHKNVIQTMPLQNGQSVSANATPGQNQNPNQPLEHASKIDKDDALAERALGDEDAPVKIEEYASLTCSHCAHFYNETFPKIKKQYIDTKKVYFVFSDFPLNAPAMHASMIARCLPQKNYFGFVEMLFSQQEKWGFDPNYLTFLKEKAKGEGLNEPTFQACIQDTEIQDGIVKRMEAASTQFQVSSTPTFIINNKQVINGDVSEADFVKAIEMALGNPAPREQLKSVTPAVTPATAASAAKTTTSATSTPAPASAKDAIITKSAAPPATATDKSAAPKTPVTSAQTPATTSVPKSSAATPVQPAPTSSKTAAPVEKTTDEDADEGITDQ